MPKPNGKKVLVAKCHQHPRYTAERKPKNACESCWLLYVMRWQHEGPQGETKIGSLNPYTYTIADVNLEEACSGIKVRRTPTAQV